VRYLPGSALGLRAFSGDSAALLLTDINGQATGLRVRSLQDFSLIALVADRAEDVRAYAEQVAPLAQQPIIAAVSYSAAPLVEPYFVDSATMRGLLVGYGDGYTYSGLIGGVTPFSRADRPIQPLLVGPTATPTPTITPTFTPSRTPSPTRDPDVYAKSAAHPHDSAADRRCVVVRHDQRAFRRGDNLRRGDDARARRTGDHLGRERGQRLVECPHGRRRRGLGIVVALARRTAHERRAQGGQFAQALSSGKRRRADRHAPAAHVRAVCLAAGLRRVAHADSDAAAVRNEHAHTRPVRNAHPIAHADTARG